MCVVRICVMRRSVHLAPFPPNGQMQAAAAIRSAGHALARWRGRRCYVRPVNPASVPDSAPGAAFSEHALVVNVLNKDKIVKGPGPRTHATRERVCRRAAWGFRKRMAARSGNYDWRQSGGSPSKRPKVKRGRSARGFRESLPVAPNPSHGSSEVRDLRIEHLWVTKRVDPSIVPKRSASCRSCGRGVSQAVARCPRCCRHSPVNARSGCWAAFRSFHRCNGV